MMGDFRNQLMERYGEITPELLEREELDLDYDLASLEDILYFPNLKTLNLGKNRYFGSTQKVASLTDANKRARMYFCANVLNELNEGMDVNVYRAGNKAGDMVFYNFKQKLGVYEYEGMVNAMACRLGFTRYGRLDGGHYSRRGDPGRVPDGDVVRR